MCHNPMKVTMDNTFTVNESPAFTAFCLLSNLLSTPHLSNRAYPENAMPHANIDHPQNRLNPVFAAVFLFPTKRRYCHSKYSNPCYRSQSRSESKRLVCDILAWETCS